MKWCKIGSKKEGFSTPFFKTDGQLKQLMLIILLVVDNDVRAVCTDGQFCKHTLVPHDGTAVGVHYWLWDILIALVGHLNTKILANHPMDAADNLMPLHIV